MRVRSLHDRRGYVMAYWSVLIPLVAMPLMLLAVELTRMLYVEVHLQAAVDAACEAAVQAVNTAYFIQTGELRIIQSAATTNALREFNGTVIRHGIQMYDPALTSLTFPSYTSASCIATAQIEWYFPGLPASELQAEAFSAVQARQ